MPLPELFRDRLRIPVIAAPMFLVSGPELVIASCRAGVAGSFPTLNARPVSVLEEWLQRITGELGPKDAPFGVNLIVHDGNERLAEDLALTVKYRVPFVITSLGFPADVVKAVHAYGGVVFHDVIRAYHAKKAIQARVDGIIAGAAGAGGHAGTQNPFVLVREIREFWEGPLVLGGTIADGAGVRAAEVLGADLAYIGTRWVATKESMAKETYKQMIVDSGARDIVYTPAISGTHGNYLWPSLEKAGYVKSDLGQPRPGGHKIADESRAWRDIWSGGQGVALIHDVPSVAELVDRLEAEYQVAKKR
ncbi:MAG TPA: nitronate monooxygenase [Rhodocyclaceae bacterium]|nr:nitronate monooxygenase [Rhodocyclaceae bacterium]